MADTFQPLNTGDSPTDNKDFFSDAYLEKRRRAMEHPGGLDTGDELDPKLPAGHEYGIRTSSRLTSDFRRQHRKGGMDITPQDVVDVLTAAGVKNWVLMGLHGYVGYMPDPRATQDVDVMVPYSERKRATKAIATKWPTLEDVPLIEPQANSDTLVEALIRELSLPNRAAADAVHIALAVGNGIDFLLTWNCTHIANAANRPIIERVCNLLGYVPPVICTPEELL